MKKLLLSTIALMGCMAVGAQSKMIVNGANNSTDKFDLANVSKITFTEDGALLVHDLLGDSKAFSLEGVNTITFEGDFTAISTPQTSAKGHLNFAYNGKEVSINGLEHSAIAIICSTSGAVVARQRVSEGQAVSVESLAKGVYVVVVDGASFKFVK